MMRVMNLVRGLGAAGLLVGIAAPVFAEKAPVATSGSNYAIQVGLEATSAVPGSGDSLTSAVSVFREVPSMVRLSATQGTLSLSRTSAGSGRLSVATGGASKCIQVFAHSRGEEPVPLQFAIVKQGDRDPCTNQAPAGPVLDYTTPAPSPQPYTHKYWVLRCKKGQGCHWVKVICTHAPGVP